MIFRIYNIIPISGELMDKLYSGLKIFHFNRKIQDLESGRITPPLHVRLKPINRCNHSCSYCCYRNKNLFLGQNLDETDMIPKDRLIKLTQELALAGVKAVTFSGGGEPLCHPAIAETVKKLSLNNIKTAFLTNGSLLKGEKARVIAENCSWVRISMDGISNEMYTETRNVKSGEFDKICTNIKEFVKIKRPECELGINFIVTEKNYHIIDDFIMLMNDLGADHIKISEAVISTDVRENREYLRPFYFKIKEKIKKASINLNKGPVIKEHPNNGPVNKGPIKIIDMIHNVQARDNEYEKAYTWCPFIQCISVIGADLKVYTCQDKAYTLSGELGDLKNTSFNALWADPNFQKRLKSINPSSDCCHHCVQNSKNIMLLDFLGSRPDHLDFV
jgi:MoaA/NifB/PqqE/SkfB family radical SAM enzyme